MEIDAELLNKLGIVRKTTRMEVLKEGKVMFAVVLERYDVWVQVYLARDPDKDAPTVVDAMSFLIESGQRANRGEEEFIRLGGGHLSESLMSVLFETVLVSDRKLRKLLGSDELYASVVFGDSALACAN